MTADTYAPVASTVPANADSPRANLVRLAESKGWTRLFACPTYDVLRREDTEITVWFAMSGQRTLKEAELSVGDSNSLVAQVGRGKITVVEQWLDTRTKL